MTEVDATELTNRLKDLQQKAGAQHQRWRLSHEEICEQVVATYLWWRDARQVEGYLQDQFDKRGIKWRRPKKKK